jgi:hypothetical protein
MKWIKHLYLVQGDDGSLDHEMTNVPFTCKCALHLVSQHHTPMNIHLRCLWTPKEGVVLGHEMPFSRTKKKNHVFI